MVFSYTPINDGHANIYDGSDFNDSKRVSLTLSRDCDILYYTKDGIPSQFYFSQISDLSSPTPSINYSVTHDLPTTFPSCSPDDLKKLSDITCVSLEKLLGIHQIITDRENSKHACGIKTVLV
ncbi:MAG: hypothetical protein AABX19_00615 [Nanoarchaeota archaeon]